ncbi:hypothetical protein RFI_10383, partial [Reticulomyxa filosa]
NNLQFFSSNDICSSKSTKLLPLKIRHTTKRKKKKKAPFFFFFLKKKKGKLSDLGETKTLEECETVQQLGDCCLATYHMLPCSGTYYGYIVYGKDAPYAIVKNKQLNVKWEDVTKFYGVTTALDEDKKRQLLNGPDIPYADHWMTLCSDGGKNEAMKQLLKWWFPYFYLNGDNGKLVELMIDKATMCGHMDLLIVDCNSHCKWYSRNYQSVVLVGDSAHAGLPMFGYGCNQAFADAIALAHVLGNVQNEYSATTSSASTVKHANHLNVKIRDALHDYYAHRFPYATAHSRAVASHLRYFTAPMHLHFIRRMSLILSKWRQSYRKGLQSQYPKLALICYLNWPIEKINKFLPKCIPIKILIEYIAEKTEQIIFHIMNVYFSKNANSNKLNLLK